MILSEIKKILPYFLKHKNVWANYDSEADTIYLHYKKPNHADRTEMTDDEIIFRYEKNEIIGVTILNASRQFEYTKWQNKPFESKAVGQINEDAGDYLKRKE